MLDAGTLASWLGEIKGWLDKHPNDVVTLLLVNSDNVPTGDLATSFHTSGIDSYGFVPRTDGVWPTLQEMITANKRLVVFVNAVAAAPDAAYLLNEFDYLFENAYNVTTPTGFSCDIDRPTKALATAAPQGKLGLMNHMLYTSLYAFGQSIQTPTVSAAGTTNAQASLGQSANDCKKAWGGGPTFLLVDFVDVGDGVKVIDGLNGVGDTGGRAEAAKTTPAPSQASIYSGDATAGKSKSAGIMGLAAGACALLTMSC